MWEFWCLCFIELIFYKVRYERLIKILPNTNIQIKLREYRKFTKPLLNNNCLKTFECSGSCIPSPNLIQPRQLIYFNVFENITILPKAFRMSQYDCQYPKGIFWNQTKNSHSYSNHKSHDVIKFRNSSHISRTLFLILFYSLIFKQPDRGLYEKKSISFLTIDSKNRTYTYF